ncbi:MAG: SlyX family protein [Aromatoleum sp.]|jgi:SlyX protein|uniref:SlyX family protein n=1 Tax=Aromatoleum sp. TaxID=2307007 RepID=UPI0028962A30|nr:SlyX family protein [Aromatoleum sp.]MDT3670229.1 SlyX family protein [Aromatoleum sp.]
MEDRLTRIETKVAFSEDLLDELNKTIYRQQQQIDRLQLQILELRRHLAAVAPGEGPRNLRDEIPPHY